jgi:spore coat protein CotH
MKKTPFILLFSCWLLSTLSQAQDLYDLNTIQEIKLTFTQSNWDALLDQLKASDEEAYLLAASVEINGVVFDSVGVKYKGNSSYSANNQKNPMHIEIDYVHKNADYQGYSDIKLGNGFADPTFVREPLSYEILSQYMLCPRANFAQLWINGVYWGLYSNQESINSNFIKDHLYTDGTRPFFKCNPIGGAGPGSSGNPDLVYSSADSSAYYSRYELKSDDGWAQLLQLMSTLKNNTAQIETILDVDRTLWMLAFNDVLVNLDSYTGTFAQNYYLYQDENGRFIPIVWDLNMSFGGFPNLGSSGGGPGGGLSTTQMQQMDPLVQSTNASRPLISKLLAIPRYKKQYLAHLRSIVQENFATTAYRDRALAMQAIISQAVQDDTKKFYTYANFTGNIDNAISGGGFGGVPGITQLMNARYNYLNTNSNLTATAPAINNILYGSDDNQIWINASVNNANAVLLGYRTQNWKVFEKVALYDDGAHHDGAAGDGVYGVQIPLLSLKYEYYIYAENDNAGRFAPERAEYEFYQMYIELAAPHSGQVLINELLADNETGSEDEFGQREDWLELFNTTNTAYDLGGLWLSDDPADPRKYEFPRGVLLPSDGYLVVWLDSDSGQGGNHANFKLSAGGEFIMLSDSLGNVFDSLSFGQQSPDISFGRYPNGSGPFQEMPTTIGAINSLTSPAAEPNAPAGTLQLSPNPAKGRLRLRADTALGQVWILDALGRVWYQADAAENRQWDIDLPDSPAGMYWVRTQGAGVRALVRLVK